MKLKTLSPKKANQEKTIITDVNGNEGIAQECFVKMVGSYRDKSSMKRVYYPIIKPTEAPKNAEFQYIIDFGDRGLVDNHRPDVEWLESRNSWVLLRRGEFFVNVMFIDDSGNTVSGRGVYDPYITVQAFDRDSNDIFIVDHDTAIRMGYVPSKSSNSYHTPNLKSTNRDLYMSLNKKNSYNLPINTTHHADENNECYNRVKEIFDTKKFVNRSKETAYMSRLLGGKTFGVEYEVVDGTIPSPMLGELGVTALTDGSIGRQNYEITTVPLEGSKGLEAMRLQCETLAAHAKINSNCALHIHIGNVTNDKLTFISLYALMHRLQSEIYAIHPYYKQHEMGIMGKSKEYSRALPSMGLKRNKIFNSSSAEEFNAEVSKWHSKLYKYFACAEESSEFSRGNNQKGRQRRTMWGAKWHCPTRYYWANFINYLFSKSGTIEFRIHEPTTNFSKVSASLLLCTSLVRYAEKYPELILQYSKKITLEDVLSEIRTNFTGRELKGKFGVYCNEVCDWMLNYVETRENMFYAQLEAANQDAATNHRNSFKVLNSIYKALFKRDMMHTYEHNGRHSLY